MADEKTLAEDIARGLSHNINNVLASIIGNISVARAGLSHGDPASRRLDAAERASFRLQDLTERLQLYARRFEPICQLISVEHVVSEALASVEISADLSLTPGLMLQADPALLIRVLRELLENAREAGGVSVSITSRIDGGQVEIVVTDRGKGVSAEIAPRMFDPFVSTQARGRGLGLSIVESLMRVHGGTVEHAAPEGGGASFTLRLAGEKDVRTRGAATVLRVLVMDDEEALREILADMIQLLGHEVETAASGEEALEKFERARQDGLPFGLVLLDLVVPAGDGGMEILQRLRQQTPGLRAVVSSGYWAEATTQLSPSGFQAALIKPFTLDDVRTAVEQALNGGSD